MIALQDWLRTQFGHQHFTCVPLTGDASQRRYYRIHLNKASFIVMQNPGNVAWAAFLNIQYRLQTAGLSVPTIYAQNPSLGLLLLSDFGDRLYLQALNESSAPQLYGIAMQSLIWMQSSLAQHPDPQELSEFSCPFMVEQLNLFKEWYLSRHLGLTFSATDWEPIQNTLTTLIKGIAEQPYTFAHLDFHSRNLMVLSSRQRQQSPGILDFQDAMWAPITLDLVSLLKDCYINWSREQVVNWVFAFYDRKAKHESLPYDRQQFLQWFDWMGLQRHLRILGTFARLHHRDRKSGYLGYFPRILHYIQEVINLYPIFHPLEKCLDTGAPLCAQ